MTKLATTVVSTGGSTFTLKMQGAWGANDIFSGMAQLYAKRVNEMAVYSIVTEG